MREYPLPPFVMLEKAFSEIDLSETMKIKIWAEIEKRIQ